MFPGAANSKIERAEKDETVIITMIKMSGSKGNGQYPLSCKKGAENPLPSFPSRNRSHGFLSRGAL
jgi:hypothetical protein